MCDISIIIPIYNGEKWVGNCLQSVAAQSILKTNIKLEIVTFNDGSTDSTQQMLEKWSNYFIEQGVGFTIAGSSICRGVGAAKNEAVKKSIGKFLCFQDIDDMMLPDRILLQWEYAIYNHNSLIGSKILRVPVMSTPRYVKWANSLSPSQLKTQIYTSYGPTLLMPTWFCHRSVFDKVGGFVEAKSGIPEDLLFFYSHIDLGGELHRVDEELVIYTYCLNGASFSVTREKIWEIQLDRIQKQILPFWNKFTVWNAGKAGRKFVRALSTKNREKVLCFCDVDMNKIGSVIELYCSKTKMVIKKVPVVHFRNAKPPLIICMKLDLTNGQFENNLKSLKLQEGIDYIIFN